ncbi:4-hydroxy-3-methylbut-2-enyl diphosphate reductase [Dyadobacter chenwenxiniae]|uniref:4-hydroxy-3-methylbut-2-enyl diphosphate reductase n=1 Tax=Dyadobacter chenwenxiniae TaxID=2906456 RepID=A0A9X1THR5_9BACT|nr:4-hydroxy-3-methylbut-2-enyl diphosphate reductase [Dyadobacter chenwenxiniae]MCF0065397.1 4-hydroxy-3-methylbut-2-enyl diphosphate reductase [Dyadobacter chenwenxiniae]UON82191.1 4-hydroxy-3-methylbut-2-enyl diphosphate reductase [Dyadobacter chenwenxiniae]
MKTFNIPDFYRSRIITPIKEFRRKNDKLKRDYAPTLLDFGPVQFLIARHFGFCYGVENAIDIAYKAIAENPDKRIFLLSEMIHNPDVNRDLVDRGVRFIMDTKGNPLIPWETLTSEDIVIVPAFGTTVENQQKLTELGINAYVYDTTCPFVEKVWNRAAQIGEKNYTIIVHGKPNHEETRATFSHSKENAPTVVVENMAQAERLAEYMKGTLSAAQFFQDFKDQYSNGFDPEKDLQRIGVVNQTTMLASDTQGIADFLKNVMIKHYSLRPEQVEDRFANTRDTLCYATNDNQDATYALLTHEADLVIVAGGYNSSNTTHLVELCEQKFPTYFIESVNKILDKQLIRHFNMHSKEEIVTENYLPKHTPARIMLTCGASCPDAVVEGILTRLLSFYEGTKDINEVMEQF